jgi:putative peptidoglycan lipid II flippase
VSSVGDPSEASIDAVSDQQAGSGERTRAAGRMAAVTAVSRATGFARTVTVAAVLGATYLGNTYQTANAVPNLLFELFAAGALQAVLVPVMVDAIDRSRDDAEHAAGAVLGAALTLLAGVMAVGLVAAPWLMRLLFSGVSDTATRAAEVELGTFFLWFFLPQVLFYALNLVATAVLNATGRFSLPAFAPTVNNVVVIGTYLLFAWMRDGEPPSLELTGPQQLVLAAGTTLGVVAFCSVPFIGVWRTGFRLRPRLDLRHPMVARVARQGAWAAGFLAASQLLLGVMLVLANGSEGGVVVQQLAYVLFLLPVSLLAVPVFTTAFPTMTRRASANDWSGYADEVGRVARSVVFLTVLSAAGLVALSAPLSRLVALGNASVQSVEVERAIAAFAVGLPGFAMVLFLTRASYARRVVRTPTMVNVLVAAFGAVIMLGLVQVVEPGWRIAILGLGNALAQSVGAVLLTVELRTDLIARGQRLRGQLLPAMRVALAAVLAVGSCRWLVERLSPDQVVPALVAVVVGVAVVGAIGVAVVSLLGGPRPAALVASKGGATRS